MTLSRVVRHALKGACFIALLAFAEPATAQECGNWYRPVLCEVELVAVDNQRRTIRLDDRTDIQIAPREVFELELLGRDQRGRRFPSDRLVLGYDTSDCRSMVEVEGSGQGVLRISARAAAGRCELYFWVPGNLNFEWALEIEINPGARVGYSRDEAEIIVNALYAAILDREADDEGFRLAVPEVQAGNLESLISSTLRSAEFRQSVDGVDASLLLERFYQGMFGRPPDTGGVRLYVADMRRGLYADVLLKLIRSPEFERLLAR